MNERYSGSKVGEREVLIALIVDERDIKSGTNSVVWNRQQKTSITVKAKPELKLYIKVILSH